MEALATRSIEAEPLNPKALRILGEVAIARGNISRAEHFMRLAFKQSRRERNALRWLMTHSHASGQYGDALRFADILLRSQRQPSNAPIAVIADIIEKDPETLPQLISLLQATPRWRPLFLRLLPRATKDMRTPLTVMQAMSAAGVAPTADEVSRYVNFLVQQRAYGLAYFVWLDFLPAEQLKRTGFIYNTDFQTEPSGLAFDWRFSGGEGVNIRLTPRRDDPQNRALRLSFGYGRVKFPRFAQLLLVPSGQHVLRGEQYGLLRAKRGLVWSIQCVGDRTLLGQTEMLYGPGTQRWAPFSATFSIPADCPVQRITLSLADRSSSERFVSGEVWFDNVRIERATPPDDT